MKINVYFINYCEDRAWGHVYRETYHNLIKKYPNDEFSLIYSENNLQKPFLGGSKFNEQFMIIENDATKKYIVLSYWDYVVHFTYRGKKYFWDSENCAEIITSSGTFESQKTFKPMNLKYTPFSYVSQVKKAEPIIDELYYNPRLKHVPKNLKFRGHLYVGLREFFIDKMHFDMRSTKTEKFGIYDYLHELSKEYISFSINGAGEVCHRDIEILGLGNALFRTKLNNVFHDPLIPNYHYIAAEYQDKTKEDLISDITDLILRNQELERNILYHERYYG